MLNSVSLLLLVLSVGTISAFRSMSKPSFVRSTSLFMKDIVDTAVGAGSFNTLAAALTAAGLVPTLKGSGPFTVFAPTDAAFEKLPAGTVEGLLKDIPALTSILTYHVVPGRVLASTVVQMNGRTVKTVNGAEVTVTVAPEGVKVDAANVVTTDILCDNGVIHVIDTVIIPKPAAPSPPPAPVVPPFNPKLESGVSGPFGFFDPFGLSPDNKADFRKYRESEIKHGRLAMLAFLGIVAGEKFPIFFGDNIDGPAIYQYQQAEDLFNAWSANVIGLTLAVEGFNIVRGWQEISETMASEIGLAGLKPSYVNGDLNFDPLGLKPKNAKDLKSMETKELNNGRLAMIAVAGIVVQELITNSKIFA